MVSNEKLVGAPLVGALKSRHPGIPNEVREYPGSIRSIFIGSRISSASPFGSQSSFGMTIFICNVKENWKLVRAKAGSDYNAPKRRIVYVLSCTSSCLRHSVGTLNV